MPSRSQGNPSLTISRHAKEWPTFLLAQILKCSGRTMCSSISSFLWLTPTHTFPGGSKTTSGKGRESVGTVTRPGRVVHRKHPITCRPHCGTIISWTPNQQQHTLRTQGRQLGFYDSQRSPVLLVGRDPSFAAPAKSGTLRILPTRLRGSRAGPVHPAEHSPDRQPRSRSVGSDRCTAGPGRWTDPCVR